MPDGRNRRQQEAFELVEAKPQALEWLFTQACARRFHPSSDNLSAGQIDNHRFRQAVLAQVHSYCRFGMPERARQFRSALCAYYGVADVLEQDDFCFAEHSGN